MADSMHSATIALLLGVVREAANRSGDTKGFVDGAFTAAEAILDDYPAAGQSERDHRDQAHGVLRELRDAISFREPTTSGQDGKP